MPLYTYSCPQGHTTEALRKVDATAIPCACGQEAQRRDFYRTSIGGQVRTPVSQRTVNLKHFIEATEQMAYEHERAEDMAQQRLPEPPLWDIARKRADTLMKAGVKDSLDYRPDYIKD